VTLKNVLVVTGTLLFNPSCPTIAGELADGDAVLSLLPEVNANVVANKRIRQRDLYMVRLGNWKV
jgi:hypothetical protein